MRNALPLLQYNYFDPVDGTKYLMRFTSPSVNESSQRNLDIEKKVPDMNVECSVNALTYQWQMTLSNEWHVSTWHKIQLCELHHTTFCRGGLSRDSIVSCVNGHYSCFIFLWSSSLLFANLVTADLHDLVTIQINVISEKQRRRYLLCDEDDKIIWVTGLWN